MNLRPKGLLQDLVIGSLLGFSSDVTLAHLGFAYLVRRIEMETLISSNFEPSVTLFR